MKSHYKKLGEYIRQVDIRNTEGKTDNLLGVSVAKQFIPSIANTVGTDFTKYKVVKKGQFTYIPDTSRRGDKIGIALLEDYDEGLVSNVYTVFEVIDEKALIPQYLMLWFSRPEFDRFARFKSHGSVREVMDWDEMCNVELPIPTYEEQKQIVDSYNAIRDRIALKKQINDNLEAQALSLFSNFISLSDENWKQGKLGDAIAAANTGGDAIQKVPIVDYDTGVKCARVGDITNAREYASWAFCKATKAVFENYKLQAGDILVTRTATLGITQYISNDISAVYNNGLIRLKVDCKTALPLYIYWAINTTDFMNYINQMNSATSVRPNMKIDYLLNYPLLIPPITKQEQFTRSVEAIRTAISLNNDEILKLVELQTTVLTTLSSR